MLVSDAITNGYREGNIIPLGTTPSTAEFAEGLELLNGFWKSLLGNEIGENLIDWRIPSSTTITVPQPFRDGDLYQDPNGAPWLYPLSNARLLVTLTSTARITFPAWPDPGARLAFTDVGSTAVLLTLDGNGWLIEGSVAQTNVTPASLNGSMWFFRDDLASWERVKTLALTDQLPLPDDHNDLFISYLAVRLGPRNSQEALDDTRKLYADSLARVKARYRQTAAVGVTEYGTNQTRQSYIAGSDGGFY